MIIVHFVEGIATRAVVGGMKMRSARVENGVQLPINWACCGARAPEPEDAEVPVPTRTEFCETKAPVSWAGMALDTVVGRGPTVYLHVAPV